MSLSTHVLDTAAGTTAAGIPVSVERSGPDGWSRVGGGVTDRDGRIADLIEETVPAPHRLIFDVSGYLAARQQPQFWGDIVITFHITDPAAHHHIPLLLSPFGYSTYRGS